MPRFMPFLPKLTNYVAEKELLAVKNKKEAVSKVV